MLQTENDSKGKTTLETETVTFRAQLVEGVKEAALNQLAYFISTLGFFRKWSQQK